MTEQEAILYMKGYKATSDSAQVHTAIEMAIQALEKQTITAEMDISYTKELPHHITLKIDYSDLLNTDENKFIEGLQRCIIQLYRQAKTDWSDNNDD